jgi:hypothetical protein
MMVARLNDGRIEAARGLIHRLDYRCPECDRPVVLHARTGGWVIPHFKHKAKSACSNTRGETVEHRAVKDLLRNHYRAKGHDVELEYIVANRRADVFVAGLGIAFEVEFSQKETREVITKCRDYAARNVKSVWILRQRRLIGSDIQIGNDVVVAVSPVSNALSTSSKMRPKGARLAFFAYDKDGVVIFRGLLSSLMLYKEEDPYSGVGGYKYPSRSREWLRVTEIIRLESSPPTVPDTGSELCWRVAGCDICSRCVF